MDVLNKLKVPYDKKFFNMKYEHYIKLSEENSTQQVINWVRELLVEYQHDTYSCDKARLLMRKLNKNILMEGVESNEVCECGFETLGEDYEKCPICSKRFYPKEGPCYYKNDDNSCSLDGEDCKWLTQEECGKLKAQ